jgi:hypothetical protein
LRALRTAAWIASNGFYPGGKFFGMFPHITRKRVIDPDKLKFFAGIKERFALIHKFVDAIGVEKGFIVEFLMGK